ncbi:MAG: hypothetical protein JSR89_10150 [Proteobacteria bacterium]|nr:hypothetical protein [Pseudomonadota bacterium]
MLNKVLAEKADGLAKAQEEAWRKLGKYLTAEAREHTDQQLLSHWAAAKMLSCFVATVKRMVYDGRVPQPV